MIAWIALVLALVAILLWLIVAYTLRRIWRTVGPQVTPLLAMFGGPPLELPTNLGQSSRDEAPVGAERVDEQTADALRNFPPIL